MNEKLPKDCMLMLDNLAASFDGDAVLGFEIGCSSSGRNKFTLKIEFISPLKIYYLGFNYNIISVPSIGKLFNEIYPDFILKPTQFMPLSKLIDNFKLDKEKLSSEIMKKIRTAFNDILKYYHIEGVSITLLTDAFDYKGHDRVLVMQQKFKSFYEFLVGIDLNVH